MMNDVVEQDLRCQVCGEEPTQEHPTWMHRDGLIRHKDHWHCRMAFTARLEAERDELRARAESAEARILVVEHDVSVEHESVFALSNVITKIAELLGVPWFRLNDSRNVVKAVSDVIARADAAEAELGFAVVRVKMAGCDLEAAEAELAVLREQMEAERWRPVGVGEKPTGTFQVMTNALLVDGDDHSLIAKAPWEGMPFGGAQLCWWIEGNDWKWRPMERGENS